MEVRNTIYHREMPFAEYLALPGTSYSSIKGFVGSPTPGMSLGTKVHQYLLEPTKYTWEDANIVREIAAAIRPVLGAALAVLEKEIAFTSKFHYNGFILQYKGRADMLLVGKIVVDLKVLSGALQPAIDRFGYGDQIPGYGLATGSATGLIVAYNRARKRVETKLIPTNSGLAYWQYQTVHRGIPNHAISM